MNIVVIRDKLKDGLDAVSRTSSGNQSLPILKNALIEVKDNSITLTSTDLEVGLKYKISGKTVEDGSISVPAALFAQIVSNLSDERVEVSNEGATLSVSTESYKAKLQGSPADEFPALPEIENSGEHIEIQSDVLRSALESALAAGQYSELRPELSSVFFQFVGDKIILVATDSFRLAEKTLNESQFSSTIIGDFKVLVPLKTAQELVRSLKDKGQVRIYRDPGQILFRTEHMDLISRLIDGSFPDYRAVVPKECQAEIFIDRDEFLGAVKLAGVMSGSASETVLRRGDGDILEIFSRDEKLGENVYRLPAKIKGEFQEANFNWKYLLEGARSMPPREMVIGLNDESKPAMLKSRQDPSYFYILMPILKN